MYSDPEHQASRMNKPGKLGENEKSQNLKRSLFITSKLENQPDSLT